MIDVVTQRFRRHLGRRGIAARQREIDEAGDVARVGLLRAVRGPALQGEEIMEPLDQEGSMARLALRYLRLLRATSHARIPATSIAPPMIAAAIVYLPTIVLSCSQFAPTRNATMVIKPYQ